MIKNIIRKIYPFSKYKKINLFEIMNLNKYFSLIFLTLLAFNSTAEMTGSFRKEYVDGHTNTCIRTQSASSVNAGASSNSIRQYCRCSAIYIADLLNNQLATEIYEGRQKFNPRWHEMSANYCRINFSKY